MLVSKEVLWSVLGSCQTIGGPLSRMLHDTVISSQNGVMSDQSRVSLYMVISQNVI